MSRFNPLLFAMLAAVVASGPAIAADQIRIVGSSTVYPFSSYVAEEFGETTRFQTPVVESTGSGGGHKLFGAGVGPDTPDLTNSSRKMKVSELKRAQENGVEKITEAVIGYDGIALAQNVDNEPVDLSLEELTLAVAAKVPNPDGGDGLVDNPYTQWDQIAARLPAREIKIYGPPTTSGTRDAFEELAMEAATEDMAGYAEPYTQIRQDGAWIDSGENDNLIVQKLAKDKAAFGVFGFSFLDENRDQIQGAKIGGVAPRPATISSGEYPLSRSLYFYVKNNHVGEVPGLMEYVQLFMSEAMIGPDGALKAIGLVPLPQDLRAASRERVLSLVPLALQDGRLSTLKAYAESRQDGEPMARN
ncbi:phosphate-binding protein [Thiohalocapsa halophila]|uniref:Phosphate-binding protein n=1 Tax=Thiohalocapsa halophila TaxID=69359 RepID=A0ABS1CGR7_9GAMM|nr:PstS family phosphate ABC transporter substrate-binding protein [Thiohalocapsa halophila]MBK1631110.1 phosphate-binding protein [Thiohalocapsa halophila]